MNIIQATSCGRDFKFTIGWSAWIGGGLLAGWIFLNAVQAGFAGTNLLMVALVPVGILAGSVLVHEISHAVLMETNGVRVGKIALEVWGGYTAPSDPNLLLWRLSPSKYFFIVISGPIANLLIAAGIWLFVFDRAAPSELVYSANAMTEFWLVMAYRINLFMGIFNLLPLFPLDGGHALRSILTAMTGVGSVAGVLSGVFSMSLGIASLRSMVAEYQHIGWQAVSDNVFLLMFGAIVVVFSGIILLEAFWSAKRELGEVTINSARKVAIVLLAIAVMATVYALHFEGYWASLPQI